MILLILNALKNGMFAVGGFVARVASWLFARPYMLVAGLAVALTLIGTMYQKRGLQIESLQKEATTLTNQNTKLTNERESAYRYADSTTRKSDATKDSIRTVISTMPAAARHQLNRKLLSDLGLL